LIHIRYTASADVDLDVATLETQQQLEFRLQILHMAVLYLCSFARPSVVHWKQSEQLFTGEGYLKFINDELPLPVVMHPLLEMGDTDRELRADVLGSAEMLGKPLSIESTPLNADDLFQVALFFTHYCRQMNAIPGAGETFGREGEWLGQVEEIPANEFLPTGELSLSIIRHKTLGGDPKKLKPRRQKIYTRPVPDTNEANSMRDQILLGRTGPAILSRFTRLLITNRFARFGVIGGLVVALAWIAL